MRALLIGSVLAISGLAAAPRPAAAACQFVCDTLSVVNVPHAYNGVPGSGTVSTTDGRINCVVVAGVVQSGSVCSFRYTLYTVTFPYAVHISLAPAAGSYVCFNATCYGEGQIPQDYLTLDPPGQTEATNELDFSFFLTQRELAIGGTFSGGSVSSTPSGITCGASCVALFEYGQMVTLTASPNAGQMFTGWQGDCAGQLTTSCTLTMTADHSTNPTFGPAPTSGPTPRPTSTPTATHGPGSTVPPTPRVSGPPPVATLAATTAPGATLPPTAPSGEPTPVDTVPASSGSLVAQGGPTATIGTSDGPPATAASDASALPMIPLALAIFGAGVAIAIGLAVGLRGRR